jgi:hypothetical protein
MKAARDAGALVQLSPGFIETAQHDVGRQQVLPAAARLDPDRVAVVVVIPARQDGASLRPDRIGERGRVPLGQHDVGAPEGRFGAEHRRWPVRVDEGDDPCPAAPQLGYLGTPGDRRVVEQYDGAAQPGSCLPVDAAEQTAERVGFSLAGRDGAGHARVHVLKAVALLDERADPR